MLQMWGTGETSPGSRGPKSPSREHGGLTAYGDEPWTCSREYWRLYFGMECAELLSFNIRGLQKNPKHHRGHCAASPSLQHHPTPAHPQPHDVRSPRGQGTLGWPPLGRRPGDTQPAPTGSPSAGFASLWSRNAKPQASESPREALSPLLCGAALPHARVSGAQLRHEHRCGPILYPSAAGRCSPYGINHWGTSRTGWQNEELPSLITIEPAVVVPAIWRGWAPLAHKGAAPQPAGQLRARGRGSTGGLPLPMGHQVGEEVGEEPVHTGRDQMGLLWWCRRRANGRSISTSS